MSTLQKKISESDIRALWEFAGVFERFGPSLGNTYLAGLCRRAAAAMIIISIDIDSISTHNTENGGSDHGDDEKFVCELAATTYRRLSRTTEKNGSGDRREAARCQGRCG